MMYLAAGAVAVIGLSVALALTMEYMTLINDDSFGSE